MKILIFNTVFVLLIVFNCFSLQAQSDQDAPRKFTFGAVIQTGLTKPAFTETSSLIEKQWSASPGASLLLRYHFNHQWSVSSGMAVQYWRFAFRDYSIIFPHNIGSSGVDTFDSWGNLRSNNLVIGIPLLIRYQLSSSTTSMFVDAGLNFLWHSYALHEIQLQEQPSNWKSNLETSGDIPPFMVIPKLACGKSIKLGQTSRLDIALFTSFAPYGFTLESYFTDVQFYPLNLGLEVGVRF